MKAWVPLGLRVVSVGWMAFAEWDCKHELSMEGTRTLHRGGRSDCIEAAFHRTAETLASSPR